MKRRAIGMLLLLLLGLSKMAADAVDLALLEGLALATNAAPAPKVFCAPGGLETFSTTFALAWTDPTGTPQELPLTSKVYPRLKGPYNRRNVWGAVLAYGPLLATNDVTQPMFASVAHYGLCGQAPVLRELGLDPASVRDLEVRYEPLPGTPPELPRTLRVECP